MDSEHLLHQQGRSQEGGRGAAAVGVPPQTPGRLRRKHVAGGSASRTPLGPPPGYGTDVPPELNENAKDPNPKLNCCCFPCFSQNAFTLSPPGLPDTECRPRTLGSNPSHTP